MGISIGLSTTWGHILLTILSKHSLLALCRIGAPSKILTFSIYNYANYANYRCTAHLSNLDGGDSTLHHEEHTERLVQAFELGDLWDAYGVIGDIIVSHFGLLT